MDLPLIYHQDYSFPFPAPHRFPMDKFVRLHDHLRASELLQVAEMSTWRVGTEASGRSFQRGIAHSPALGSVRILYQFLPSL